MKLQAANFLVLLCAQLLLADDLADVQVKIIKESKKCDLKAEPGDYLKVHYVGRLNDENGKKFDASRDRGQLYSFQLGAGQV